MVVEVVLPEIFPGLMVQVPVGKLFNTTEPVVTTHVGWVMVPTLGALGTFGTALIVTVADATEVHPALLETVKV